MKTGGEVPSPLMRRVDLRHRRGGATLCEERMSPVRDEHGSINGMIITLRQLSARSSAVTGVGEGAGKGRPA
ncbi:hypothetical protein, partial [Verrucomicrobium spinosum]|uniref:hypothetical protein n=1 Tax=Verrucomicrobium spinosum TaxID=2736 RepID=UPI0012E1CFBC